mmetsp:Transcript_29976/g.69900  ORF Transcript_29976/g.69900 Transcript_29976/m.69900 type:complete len:302 (-) Transcript_29976:775-1680(-)
MPPSAAALRHAAAQKEAAAKKQTVKVQDVGVRQRGLKYLEGKYESKMHPGSALKDRTTEYPTFDLSQLTQGKVLGTGGFGTVKEVTGIQVGGGGGGGVKPFVNTPTKPALVDVTDGSSNSDNVPHGTGEEDDVVQNGMLESQNFIAQHCIRKGGDARYAIKHLKPDVMNDTGLFLQGVIDLAVEARFLSDIEVRFVFLVVVVVVSTTADQRSLLFFHCSTPTLSNSEACQINLPLTARQTESIATFCSWTDSTIPWNVDWAAGPRWQTRAKRDCLLAKPRPVRWRNYSRNVSLSRSTCRRL